MIDLISEISQKSKLLDAAVQEPGSATLLCPV